MKAARVLFVALCSLSLVVPVRANTYGSVEPIANPAVIDTAPLRDQELRVRVDFAKRLFGCGIVDDVIDVLTDTHAISTVNRPEHALPGAVRGASQATRIPPTSTP